MSMLKKPIKSYCRRDLRELKGKIAIRKDYDYKKLRANRCKKK